MADMLPIQVCYALPQRQTLLDLSVQPGTTLQQAVEQSGILRELDGVDPQSARYGIFGKVKPPETVLQAHDRIEIYRPLQADPKEVRRQRAVRGKSSSTAV